MPKKKTTSKSKAPAKADPNLVPLSEVDKQKKAKGKAATKKLSCLSAAAQVLKAEGQAMNTRGMIAAVFEKKLWHTDAPTPAATLYSDASDELIVSLGLALNAGAIVYVPDDLGELLLTTLKGRRFRLTYLLSPYFKIPNRLGRSLSLGTILKTKLQTTLFDVAEDINE
jgi:hypothetical protein